MISGRSYTLLSDQVSKLANGVTVASVEARAATTHVSVFVKAGSRYESYERQGLTHLLRNCAFLVSSSKDGSVTLTLCDLLQSTNDRTAFRVAREIDAIGGTLRYV